RPASLVMSVNFTLGRACAATFFGSAGAEGFGTLASVSAGGQPAKGGGVGENAAVGTRPPLCPPPAHGGAGGCGARGGPGPARPPLRKGGSPEAGPGRGADRDRQLAKEGALVCHRGVSRFSSVFWAVLATGSIPGAPGRWRSWITMDCAFMSAALLVSRA